MIAIDWQFGTRRLGPNSGSLTPSACVCLMISQPQCQPQTGAGGAAFARTKRREHSFVLQCIVFRFYGTNAIPYEKLQVLLVITGGGGGVLSRVTTALLSLSLPLSLLVAGTCYPCTTVACATLNASGTVGRVEQVPTG